MEAAVAAAAAELGALRQTSSTSTSNSSSRGGGRGRRPRAGQPSRSAGNSDLDLERDTQEGPSRGRGQRSRRARGGGGGARSSGNASDTGGAVFPATELGARSRQNGHQQPRYRSQLSSAIGDAPEATSSTNPARLPPPSSEELAKLTYRERLTAQLNTSSIDCPICINTISRKQPISSCRTCSAPYHLKCLKDWAERSIATVKEKAALQQQQNGVQIRANWRCPSCQTQYAEHDAPRNYWCFCGRLREPRASGLGNAHSCEKPCKRERPEGCQHS